MLKENNVPKLRFKDFEDEWKSNLAKDLCEFNKGKGFSKKDLAKDGKPILLYGSMYTNFKNTLSTVKTFVNNIKIEACYSKAGDVVVPSSGETRDDIARATNIDANNIILGGDLNILHPNNELNSSFLSLSITYGKGHKRLSRLAQGNSVVHLYNSDLRTLKIVYPSVYEQQKIGSFFEKIDKIIELQTQKVDQLKKLKRGYLQKMFPQEGETVPRLRFSGFSGEWKEEKANDIFINESIKNHGYEEVLAATQDNGIVYRKDLDIDIKFDKTTLNKYKYVIPGNIIISLRSFQGGFEVSNKKGIISPAYTIMSFKDSENNINYWKQYLKTYKFIQSLKKVTFGIRDGRSISFKEFSTLKLKFTENKNEQQKIGDFFAKLDKLIEEQSVKLDQLKQQKKAYLQKMFI